MPRTNRLPSYRLHKASGQGVVTLNGRDHYLGAYNSRVSREQYDRLIREWLANDRLMPQQTNNGMLVVELLAAFNDWAKEYYAPKPGSDKSEYGNFRGVIKTMNALFANVPVVEFGPNKLRLLAEELSARCVRNTVNAQIRRAKYIFQWGVSREIVPVAVHQALITVKGLRSGRTIARDNPPVAPVADEVVDRTLPFMGSQIAAMVQLQRLTGMRPGEVVRMRESELDASGSEDWVYEFQRHKTVTANVRRVVFLNRQAQSILSPFRQFGTDRYLFSPAVADASRRANVHLNRKTPVNCGNRPGTNRKASPKRKPGERYTTNSYRQAIHRACIAAAGGVPAEMLHGSDDDEQTRLSKLKALGEWRNAVCWNPNQLRHSAGFRIRREYGADAAQVALGHTTLRTTERYAPPDVAHIRKCFAEQEHD